MIIKNEKRKNNLIEIITRLTKKLSKNTNYKNNNRNKNEKEPPPFFAYHTLQKKEYHSYQKQTQFGQKNRKIARSRPNSRGGSCSNNHTTSLSLHQKSKLEFCR